MQTVVLDGLADYSDRWYSFWQFVGAVATVAAVVVALWSIRRESRARAHAEEELRQERSAREADRLIADTERIRGQAERVIAWHEQQVTSQLRTFGGDHVEYGQFLRVANYSQMAVFDVKVTMFPKASGRTIGPMPPQILAPTQEARTVALAPWLQPGDGDEIAVEVTFRDVAGRHWLRKSDGYLEQTGDGRAWT